MITARPYQVEAMKALFDCWCKNPKSVPLISMPTGSGKSYQIAMIIQKIRQHKPNWKFLIVSHVKEILEQNTKEIYNLIAEPIGVYSSGLNSKTVRKITVAGVQSVYRKSKNFEVDMLIVDEAHRMNIHDDSMYQKLIDGLLEKNPNLKIFGLSATCYRMDHGSLVGNLFTEIAYDVPVRKLIEDGYLCQMISKPRGKLDFSDVERSGFDYKQSALEEKMSPLVKEHCAEILEAAKDRKSILIFCSGVKHAKDVAEYMQILSESAEYVHGEMLHMERDLIINRFKDGKTRILANCEILTTGFNKPNLECIVLLRATRSTGLYVQIVGRGMRVAHEKRDCLVLDFGGNVDRHGPIDCIEVKAKKGKEKAEITKAPTKTCPGCGAIWPIKVLECVCGYQFSRASTVEVKATSAPIISEPEILTVSAMHRKIHNKVGSPPILRIDYVCGARVISDFFCFEHGGFATLKAREKWAKIGGTPALSSAEALLQVIKTPAQIKVIKQGKFDRVLEHLGEKDYEDEFAWEFSNLS